jgi:hypothetical protein
MTEQVEYRVRMYPLHGALHDLFVIAPDAAAARQKALERCPDQMPQSVMRVSDLVS